MIDTSEWIESNKKLNPPVEIVTSGGYTLEQILKNKNCSKEPKYWHNIVNTDRYLFKSSIAESWEFFYPNIVNPIRNLNQIYLKFKDTSVFTRESTQFKINKTYTNTPPNTIMYNSYWDSQEDLCINGMEVGGVRITGRYYYVLNFGTLKARFVDPITGEESARKIKTFFRFLDHQYYLMNEIEEMMLEGPYSSLESFLERFPLETEDSFEGLQLQGGILVKARRLGITYLIANGIYSYNINFYPYSSNLLFAYEKAHYSVTLSGIQSSINFINEHTDWKKRRKVLNKRDNFRTSYIEPNELGIEIEKGFMSEFSANSFKDNPFKGIGDSADFIGVEEAGKFNNLIPTYGVSIEPLVRDGEISTGVPFIWGTAGDMEGGGSLDLSMLAYNPRSLNFKSYENIYDKNIGGESCLFLDDLWYSPNKINKVTLKSYTKDTEIHKLIDTFEGASIDCVDAQGNSYRMFAELILDKKREKAKKGIRSVYNKLITQQPKTLSEAFLVNESSPFDTATLKEQLGILKTTNKEELGNTYRFGLDAGGSVIATLDFNLNPISEFPNKDDNREGCWVLYSKPIRIGGEIPSWRYIAGTDPIDFGYDEVSNTSKHSLAATYIIDSITRNIVAEYVGRPNIAEKYYENLWRGIEYYNAELLYENNLKGLFSYFRNRNKLHLLSSELTILKDRTDAKVSNNVKGFRATEAINRYARSLIASWLLEETVVGQDSEGAVTSVRCFSIKSIALIQELISWNTKGNFDRVSSLGAAMLLLADRKLAIDNMKEKTKKREDDRMFTKGRKFIKKRKVDLIYNNIMRRR